ncbi:hypothetical protein RR48_13265 [Papilio machaon]|uniref:Uncharacterized protein n=1 Tax=Papilio machaon TaxID=76193 RepID=A0A194R1B0_PAPMA|nr:hypothetical protein RR48_13265 [Papilio machaon]
MYDGRWCGVAAVGRWGGGTELRRCACGSHRLISRDLRRTRTHAARCTERDRAMSPDRRFTRVFVYFQVFGYKSAGSSPEMRQ